MKNFDKESKVQSDIEDPENRESILKPAVISSYRELLLLSFSSLGAIYGDIGTSPLYVLNSIKYPNPSPTPLDIYGAISIIFWVFTIIVIFKYILIVLWLGPNNGEGGQVAIYAKIARNLNIGPKNVIIPGSKRVSNLQLLSKVDTSSSSINKSDNHDYVKWIILILCFLGCSLVVSDGLLTPTTSVLSAIGGIQIAKPSFNAVLPVAEVILIFLFLIQKYGSNRISFIFAPIIFLWLLGLFGCGLYNIICFHPQIFKALSPHYAIDLLKKGGIDVFSGAMLSMTGAEAMFADIGHFGRLPIQLTLATFVYPCLIFCYLGQGAYLVNHPDGISNPFFYSLPGGVGSPIFWIMFVLATLSTIIASQALILSVFSIISQLINLDCFPKLKIIHTSKYYVGKVYIPTINWILMIGVVCTTAGFKNSNNATAAYGLGISIDFLVTTTLIAITMIYVYKFNYVFPMVFVLIFVPLEVCLVVANLKKVVHGAWFALMVTSVFFIFLSLWRWGRSAKIAQEFKTRIKIHDIYPSLKPNTELDLKDALNEDNISINSITSIHNDEDLLLNSSFGETKLTRNDGVVIMYNDSAQNNLFSPNTFPMVYHRIVSQFASLPTVFIFISFSVMNTPTVPSEDRVLIGATKVFGHYKCIIKFGFMEDIKIDEALNKHILNSIPEINDLKEKYNLSSIPLLHIFEENRIKCHDYSQEVYATKNPFLHIFRFARKHIINDFFSPLNSITQTDHDLLKFDSVADEMEKKMYVGNVIRI